MRKFTTGLCLCLFSGVCAAQNPLTIDLKTIRTDLQRTAVGFAIDFLKGYNGLEQQINQSHGFFNFSPEVKALAGTGDAFSQINLKLSGFFLRAKTTSVAGLTTLDTRKTMHLFPVAVGVETDGGFSFINMLAEGGYVPYYQAAGNAGVSSFFKTTSVAFFLQAGYKSRIDSTMDAMVGGKKNASAERPNSALFRGKFDFTIDTKNFFVNVSKSGFGLIGKSSVWYDFMHAKLYRRIEGRFRIYLAADKSFDIIYENGSGAPNFNKGEQFGAGLSIAF